MEHHHGLNIPADEGDVDAYGLARTLTMDVLEDMQYMYAVPFYIVSSQLMRVTRRTFCVAVTTAYNIVTRLDRLMVAVKELVGEQYHIDGLGFVMKSAEGTPSRTESLDVRPGRDA